MSKFTWVRNPTIINGLATTYVDKRGSDTFGDGTAQNPYASIGKATSVAIAYTNMMLGDGLWDEARTANNRAFNWWGNGKSIIKNLQLYTDSLYYITAIQAVCLSHYFIVYNSTVSYRSLQTNVYYGDVLGENSIIIPLSPVDGYWCTAPIIRELKNCVIFDSGLMTIREHFSWVKTYKNCIFINTINVSKANTPVINCNFCNSTLPLDSINCINNVTTGQTFADYFNNYDANDWLKCDFTAKDGSKNIGAGEKGTTIGLNQGYTMYADNSSNDVFKASNGAVLKNVAWNENLQGYTIVQKEKVSPLGGTFGLHTITLDSSASSENGYYVGLFIGIVGGKGYGQTRLIINYNGASRLCGVDRDWDIVPDSTSVYTISGTIVSAVKDLGKVIKVKRNWTFMDMTALSDGQWSQFLTHKTADGEMFPASSYQWEYSIDGNFWYQGQTEDDLVSATDGDNKVYSGTYGDCSADFDEENAKSVTMRYIRVSVHIGFNIGE